ncbi:FAD-binding protein [Actinopolymorpha sp. NPDC004070]|uniref:FAD-binding oxidoreductase n=1 Tax=Actinopolymorpha sp. NPDC004070 TaxID=3154548 RepID=UPI0033AC64DE
MTDVTRRGFLGSAALAGVAGAGVVGTQANGAGVALADTGASAAARGGGPGAGGVGPDDPRYADLMLRGQNRRFVGHPDRIEVVRSTEDVVRAVEKAARSGRRVAVRGGGHCFENFVDDPDVKVVVDMSALSEVTWDHRRGAFAVEAGATLEQVYKALLFGWGVTVPGGGCLSVGVGGHFSGGGYGPLSRLHGSVVDHLYGVEVVVVDRSGHARPVVATRDPRDPHRDLWWAHTGGGGGNFGVVTRYFLCSHGASGNDPTRALPRPPATLLSAFVAWDWKTVTAESFGRTMANYFAWYEKHAGADSPYASLYSPFLIPTSAADGFLLSTQFDGTLPDAKAKLTAFHEAITDGVSPRPYVGEPTEGPFLNTTLTRSIQETQQPGRGKYKAAYLRKGYTAEQVATIHRHLTDPDYRNPQSLALFVPYGGKVNTVAPAATATAQRSSIMKVVYASSWTDPARDEQEVAWARNIYRDVYADTGGVPVPNAANDGSYINYPDRDLADPRWNTSGVPWHTLYYKGNYPRLQRIKAHYDPRGVFGHDLGIEPAR